MTMTTNNTMDTRKGYSLQGALFNYRTNNDTNKYCVPCSRCGAPIPVGEGIKHARKNGGFFHRGCAPAMVSYHSGADTHNGSDIHDLWQVSLEIEADFLTNNVDEKTATMRYMSDAGYACERDCTVGIEWTGKIAHNLNGVAQDLQALRSYCRQGVVTTEHSNIGTHCNVSNAWVRGIRWSEVSVNVNAIAQASIDVLAENDTLTAHVFGRSCGRWCGTTAGYHESAINTAHLAGEARKANQRFEFRICKFHSGHDKGANYYIDAVQIWKKWVHTFEVCYRKGWSTERIADKLATSLRKWMQAQDAKVSDDWKAFVEGC